MSYTLATVGNNPEDGEEIIHTTKTLDEMVEFIRKDDRFSEPEFGLDDEYQFVERGPYAWYEGPPVIGDPYIVRYVDE